MGIIETDSVIIYPHYWSGKGCYSVFPSISSSSHTSLLRMLMMMPQHAIEAGGPRRWPDFACLPPGRMLRLPMNRHSLSAFLIFHPQEMSHSGSHKLPRPITHDFHFVPVCTSGSTSLLNTINNDRFLFCSFLPPRRNYPYEKQYPSKYILL